MLAKGVDGRVRDLGEQLIEVVKERARLLGQAGQRRIESSRSGSSRMLAGRVDALVELNVLEQARNVCHTSSVQDAWARGQEVVVHGWVYGLHNGLLEDLSLTVSAAEQVGDVYRQALSAVKLRYEGARLSSAA